MTRRNNRLSQNEMTPKLKPIHVIDDFESALHLFLRDGKIRNISEHTTKFYRTQLLIMRDILEAQKVTTVPDKITEQMMKENVILYMMEEKHAKETYINCVLRSARAFFNFLVNEGYLLRSPMANVSMVKQKRTVIQTFTREQLHDVLRQPDQKTFVGVRDYTIMMLLTETGVRVRELIDINVDDIVWKDGMIKIDGKGYKQRLVPIQTIMKKQLQRYVTLRGELEHGTLFVNIDNKPLAIRQVQEQIAFYGRRAGIANVRCSPHTFRHTFAKMSVQNGADVFALQAVLGHASLEMVRNYVNLFSTDVYEKHRKFSPIEKLF